jgi:hypothetical protein
MIAWAVRFQPLQEPETLLGQREGKPSVAWDRSQWNRLAGLGFSSGPSSQFFFNLLGQPCYSRLLEEGVKREIDLKSIA